MPSTAEDAKTLSSENILDLRGLADRHLQVIDLSGREWPIAADLPLRTALSLLQHAHAWESGELTPDAFNATVDGMWAVLRRLTPHTSRDDVIDGFSVNDMIALISWLSLRMRTRAESANGEVPASSNLTTEAEVTPPPKRSARKLRAEN